MVKLYVHQGRGEIDLANTKEYEGYNKLQQFLREVLEYEVVALRSFDSRIEDGSLLLIGGKPQQPLSQAEIDFVYRYLHDGVGNGVLLLGSGGREGEDHPLNALAHRLCRVRFQSNTLEDQRKEKSYRDRPHYKIFSKLDQPALQRVLGSDFEKVADPEHLIVRLKKGKNYPFNPTEELRKRCGQPTKINVLLPASPSSSVLEVSLNGENAVLSQHDLFHLIEEMIKIEPQDKTETEYEIEYAYGCSLDCANAEPGVQVLLKGPRECDPPSAALLAAAPVGRGRLILLGSCEMFSNQEQHGLHALFNRQLMKALLNWLKQPQMHLVQVQPPLQAREQLVVKCLQNLQENTLLEMARYALTSHNAKQKIKELEEQIAMAEVSLADASTVDISTLQTEYAGLKASLEISLKQRNDIIKRIIEDIIDSMTE